MEDLFEALHALVRPAGDSHRCAAPIRSINIASVPSILRLFVAAL
jgi:hypothetical protein